MNKTLMIATAAMLSLGAGAAFADGDVYAAPAQLNRAPIAQQAAGQQSAYPANTARTSVSVYSQFRSPGYTQGGEN